MPQSLSSQFTGQDAEQLADEATVLADYEVGQRLGEGAYGSVYEAKYIPSGQRFALKVLQKEDLLYAAQSSDMPQALALQTIRHYNDVLERHIIKEATMMQSLEHPHVVKFYKFLNSTCVEDLMERQEQDLDSSGEGNDAGFQGAGTLHYMSPEAVAASSQNLFDYFGGFQNDSIYGDSTADLMRASITSSVGTGSPLALAHSGEESWTSGAEISVTKKKEKVGFFHTLMNKKPGSNRSTTGTAGPSTAWTTPNTSTVKEMDRPRHHDPANRIVTVTTPPAMEPAAFPSAVKVDPFQQDLWSAAVILFFMLTGRLPFNGRDDEETLHLIQEAAVRFTPEEEERLSPQVKDLLRGMMRRCPSDRFSREDVIAHPWFKTGLRHRKVFPHLFASTDDDASTPREADFLKFRARKSEAVTADEEAFLHSAYDAINTDELGSLSRDQLRDALTSLGKEASKSEDVTELIRLITGDGGRKEITFEEFRRAWVSKDLENAPLSIKKHFTLENLVKLHPKHLEPPTVRQLRAAFDTVDVDHTGVITVEQLRAFFLRYNIKAETADLVSLINIFRGGEGGRAATGKGGGSPATSSPVERKEGDYVAFDNFVSGIQEALLRHPMGRKLAVATNLTALFHTYNVKDCLWHGFLVSGTPEQILQQLLKAPGRLTLLHSSEVGSTMSKTYTFRFTAELDEAAAAKSRLLEPQASPFPGQCRSPGGLPPRHPHRTHFDGADFQARRSSMRATIASTMSMRQRTVSAARPHPLRLRSVKAPLQTSPGMSTGIPQARWSANGEPGSEVAQDKGDKPRPPPFIPPKGPIPAPPPLPQVDCVSLEFSPLASAPGSAMLPSPTNNDTSAFSACEVDLTLTPIGTEYVLVRFRRIYGSTNCFHDSVDFISDLLVPEREKAIQDTMPRGESELM
eukprot:gene5607-4028_t